MIFQPERIVVPALNHLLGAESWASERLRPFVGQALRIEGGPLALSLIVDQHGFFALPEAAVEPAVSISLPADTPWRLLTDQSSIFAAARLSGAADFAETLGFVFRNLRWDAEGDLARLVGDIPARRLSMLGRRFVAWQASARQNLLANVAEYATEESALVVPARELQAFAAGVAGVSEDLVSLERRLKKLGA